MCAPQKIGTCVKSRIDTGCIPRCGARPSELGDGSRRTGRGRKFCYGNFPAAARASGLARAAGRRGPGAGSFVTEIFRPAARTSGRWRRARDAHIGSFVTDMQEPRYNRTTQHSASHRPRPSDGCRSRTPGPSERLGGVRSAVRGHQSPRRTMSAPRPHHSEMPRAFRARLMMPYSHQSEHGDADFQPLQAAWQSGRFHPLVFFSLKPVSWYLAPLPAVTMPSG